MTVLPFFLQSYELLCYFLCHMGKLGAETGSGELHAGAVSRHRLDSLNTSNDLPKETCVLRAYDIGVCVCGRHVVILALRSTL